MFQMNEKERSYQTKKAVQFWRYVRVQGTWRFVMGFFASIYQLMLGIFGVYALKITAEGNTFGITCHEGLFGPNDMSLWVIKKSKGDVFITLHVIILVIQSSLNYVVYFFIPYKFNRIKKTTNEVITLSPLIHIDWKRENSKKKKKGKGLLETAEKKGKESLIAQAQADTIKCHQLICQQRVWNLRNHPSRKNKVTSWKYLLLQLDRGHRA